MVGIRFKKMCLSGNNVDYTILYCEAGFVAGQMCNDTIPYS